MSASHYCFSGVSHEDGCACDCQICEDKRARVKQEDFNIELSARIKKGSPEFQQMYAEAMEAARKTMRVIKKK